MDPVPPIDTAAAERGQDLYEEYCAACHRADLSGDPDWRVRNDDGTYPPPPQDSSGHTWHHSDATLLSIIRDGWDDPLSRMPSFGHELSDDDILEVLEFLKSTWGSDERTYQWRVTVEGQTE